MLDSGLVVIVVTDVLAQQPHRWLKNLVFLDKGKIFRDWSFSDFQLFYATFVVWVASFEKWKIVGVAQK